MEFTSRRSPVLCTHGCAASSQPLASEIGLRVLRAGGNAADACVAMAAALNVAEPCMTGIGGDAFCLFFDAKSKSVRGLNGSGRCPAALDLAAVRAAGQTAAALDAASVHCITTPGAAAAWVDTMERFGRLPLADVLAPATALAEEPSRSPQPRHFPGEASSLGLWTRSECVSKCSCRGLRKFGTSPLCSDDSEVFFFLAVFLASLDSV